MIRQAAAVKIRTTIYARGNVQRKVGQLIRAVDTNSRRKKKMKKKGKAFRGFRTFSFGLNLSTVSFHDTKVDFCRDSPFLDKLKKTMGRLV